MADFELIDSILEHSKAGDGFFVAGTEMALDQALAMRLRPRALAA